MNSRQKVSNRRSRMAEIGDKEIELPVNGCQVSTYVPAAFAPMIMIARSNSKMLRTTVPSLIVSVLAIP
jgi:hypothetical protein